MIKLRNVKKIYQGQALPAVEDLSLSINEGEICVLVGPSGCGKSTTLRMINRMIEPTDGTIEIDGKNILSSNPDLLRMGIGYVIQQIGLLPHRTIAENIAIVPRLYKWPKDKIAKRVDELLEVMGLDPEKSRNKYPSQLSGGQMQRVGVARAMAVDPSIMLMDEPFGAVDPIARNRLQDEFLRLQREIKKTIVFVTHDINEAIKMGDKIAIFNEGKIVQFGTPEDILTYPVNEFVENFIGYDRVVKKLNLYTVKKAMNTKHCIVKLDDIENIRSLMEGAKVALLQGKDEEFTGFISEEELVDCTLRLEDIEKIATRKRLKYVSLSTPLPDTLSIMLENDTDYLGVLDGDRLCGVISFRDIRRHVYRREGV